MKSTDWIGIISLLLLIMVFLFAEHATLETEVFVNRARDSTEEVQIMCLQKEISILTKIDSIRHEKTIRNVKK